VEIGAVQVVNGRAASDSTAWSDQTDRSPLRQLTFHATPDADVRSAPTFAEIWPSFPSIYR